MSIESDIKQLEHEDFSVRTEGLQAIAFRLSIVRRNIGRVRAALTEYNEFVQCVTPVAIGIATSLGREHPLNRVLALQVLGGLPSKTVFNMVCSALIDPDGIVSRAAYLTLFRLSADVGSFKAHRLIRSAYKAAMHNKSDFTSLLEKCGGDFPMAKWASWRFGMNEEKASFYFQEGESLRARGQLHTASQQYRWSLFRWPYDRATWLSLGETSLAIGEHSDGIEQLQFGCHLSPMEPQPMLRLAQALRQVGDSKRASHECEIVLKLKVGDETRREAEAILKSC